MSQSHISVLKSESIAGLNIEPGEWYIDATLGAGGHTKAILELGGKVVGIDQDEVAINMVKQDVSSDQLVIVKDNFNHLAAIAENLHLESVGGILFDLGVSSMQLDTGDRGFSFMADAPLDMRMSSELAVTAKDLINGLGKKELYDLFTKYAGEERARPIVAAILVARRIKPIQTTRELADIISRVYKGKHGRLHPATKVFQALRIAVNDELNSLKEALPQALTLLKPYGRIVVISFHEGEDRIVKETFSTWESEGKVTQLTDKPITPSQQELDHNIRARSAKLRIARKNS